MNNNLKLVKQFHETFEHPVLAPGGEESLAIRQLRIRLLFEELKELAVASDCQETFSNLCENEIYPKAPDGNNVDRVEELDALCDIQYVLNGKILTGGYHGVFDKNFEIVHANNMAKAHTSVNHALETIVKKEQLQGRTISGVVVDTTAERIIVEGYTIIKKAEGVYILENEHRKVIKPWDHKKVSLEL
jgi:predicted HAD superfamily Cof-like phosphohydrolase